MRRALAIGQRELASYFHSPIAYVAMALFLMVCGVIFRDDFQPGQPAAMRAIFDWMVWLLVFVIPVLSMGLIAQEFATGTIEPMMTAPVHETDLVLGKFLGSMMFLLVLLAPTLTYLVLLRIYARPDFGPIFAGYLGIVLVGALFISIGLFCSSLSRSQVIAAVSASAILFVITVIPWVATSRATLYGVWRDIASWGVFGRYADFSRGVIDLSNVVFFVAGTGLFLFLTVKVVESRRWR